MATVDIDLPQLSTFCSLPESSLNDLLSSPTTRGNELVKTLLKNIASKLPEYSSIKSDKVKLGVELENVVRATESKTRLLKGSVEKGLKEIADLRQKLQVAESTNSALETELQNIKSSSSSSTSEVSTLKTRITSLESSHRDTLSLLESKSTAYEDLVTELSAKHQKTIELRREISGLEQTIRSTESSSSTAKYREQNLQQEVDSLKRNNDWLEQELKTKTAEFSKFRKEKSARIAELQRQNDDATTAIESASRTEKILRTRLDEVNQKADEFLSQAQQLREDAARQEENFRSELDTANRLAELMKNSMNTERKRQQDLQAQLDQAKDTASEELGRINAEIETEHQDRVAAEHRVAELEVKVERLETDALNNSRHIVSLGSPRPMMNGSIHSVADYGNSPSPAFSPNSSRSRGGLNFTQMYSEYHSAKAELDAEKRRNEKLSTTVDEMVQELETRQPEIEELRVDHERLESDIVEMSSLVDTIGKERDQARKEARKWEGRVTGMQREGDLLRQQLRDLSSQVKVLLMEAHAHNEGLDSLTSGEKMRLEQIARGDSDEESSQDVTDTDRFISQNLTTFKHISDLQEQNTKLLRLTRELGNQMEGEEAQKQKSEASQNLEELESMRQKYERCRDEIKSLVTQSQSYIRERDMFRRMLSHRGQLPPQSDLASLFGESVDGGMLPATPSRNGPLDSIERSPTSRELADHVKALKEMQSHFDTYRQEAATDRITLREQLDTTSKKNNELRNEVSRRNGEVVLAQERYGMLQSNYGMLRSENSELQKRSQVLSERAAQQEMKVQQVAEDLVEAKGLLESMRNETANLKAEKEFWKTIEKRLSDDNQNLLNDRNRLNSLNTTLQNLQNEHEHSEKATRRRLELQIETMEGELVETKRKLNDETEENKRTALRREYEQQQSQSKIDDLISNLGSIREDLAAAKTARDHLQARLDEMTIELRSAEERLQVLQPRPSIANDTSKPGESDDTVASNTQHSVSREQELAIETSELKRDLELAHSELSSLKSQVEQYKAISQSSEEELQSLNDTQDQYREEMDKIIGEKDAKIRELDQRVDSIQSEIVSLNAEILSTRAEVSESDRRQEEQKVSFEAEVHRLTDLNDRNESIARYHQEDLKAQAEIAKTAQQNYENELVKHAEAAKSLQKVRTEYNQLRLQLAETKAEAESARTTLAQSEESWSEAKERYEREMDGLKSRRDDIVTQNKLLHKQLENVNNQIVSLQQDRPSATAESEDDPHLTVSSGSDNLQELITYIRREKEIVDVQLELSTQEAKRLKQQLDYTQIQLDEARLKLNQQRRAEENNERNALNHAKLMDTINELNLNRESNATLRLEKNQAQAALVEKTQLINELRDEISSTKVRVLELEDLKEAQEEDLRMTREARERFEQRYHDILNRSDSIDPAVFEVLKERAAALEAEREGLVSSNQVLQEQVDGIPDQIKKTQEEASERYQESRAKLIEQSKAKAREQNAKIHERDAALRAAGETSAQERQALEAQLTAVRKDLEEAKTARDQAFAAHEAVQQELTKEQSKNDREDGQVNEGGTTHSAETDMLNMQKEIDAAKGRTEEEIARSKQLQSELEVSRTRVVTLEQQIGNLQQDLGKANARILEVENQQAQQAHLAQSSASQDADSENQLTKLRQDLLQAQKDADTLRSAVSANASAAKIQMQDGSPSVAEQIAGQVEAIRAELNARHDERVQQIEAIFDTRAERMRTQLATKLKDGKEALRESVRNDHTQALELLYTQHREQIQALQTRHKEEIDELKRNETTRFEELKKDWANEHPAAPVTNGSLVSKSESEREPLKASWNPSDAEIKDLVAHNEIVKSMVRRTIVATLAKDREKLASQVREEQQEILTKALAEAENKAKGATEQAVLMEGKRHGVKLSMSENRARGALAKVEYVEKAANETPQKAVVEVWEIAKLVKPPLVTSQQVQQGSQNSPQSTTFGKPSSTVPNHNTLQASMFGQPSSTVPNQNSSEASMFGKPSLITTSQASLPHANFGQPIGQGQMPPPTGPKGNQQYPNQSIPASPTQAQPPSQKNEGATSIQQTKTNNENQQLSGQAQPSQKATENPFQIKQHNNAGTGPAALKSLSAQSSLPLPSAVRGASHQFNTNQNQGNTGSNLPQVSRGGSSIGRGRGRGSGRGGLPTVATGIPQSQGGQGMQESPTTGLPLSANAKQFVPNGNKRPREDSQEFGADVNGGKRIRGGGQGDG